MVESTTRGIRVEVRGEYLAERSFPREHKFVFAYTVRISNEGRKAAQLRRRHWIITDARGDEREVEGEGVVGEQPMLRPGESFEYTSGCVIDTPHGGMRGTYTMLRPDGSCFEAEIAAFPLLTPNCSN